MLDGRLTKGTGFRLYRTYRKLNKKVYDGEEQEVPCRFVLHLKTSRLGKKATSTVEGFAERPESSERRAGGIKGWN